MLQHKQTTVAQTATMEYTLGKFGQFAQLIGRIGKNEVERLHTTLHKAKGIALYEAQVIVVERAKQVVEERGMGVVFFYAYHRRTTTRQKFKRYASCAAKQVENSGFFEVDIRSKHVEKIFLGKICSRTGLETAGHVETPPFIFASDDAHKKTI